MRFLCDSSMSQPTASTSAKVCKRSSPNSSSPTTTVVGGGATSIFPAMKKAKSQAVASSIEGNKNEHQQITPHVHFSESTMIENDPKDVVLEAPAASGAFGCRVDAGGGGITANLARKKATPPQPTKKLVIKLVKVNIFWIQLQARVVFHPMQQ